MTGYPKQDRFLTQRGDKWYYQRLVPGRFAHIDPRARVRYSLRTSSIEIARLRRDALAEADLNYWTALAVEAAENDGVSDATLRAEDHRYKAAQTRALAYGFTYKPATVLAREFEVEKKVTRLLERVEFIENAKDTKGKTPAAETQSILGGVSKPKRRKKKVSQAFQLYLDKIAFDEVAKKSEKQRYSWQKTKKTSINYFIDVIGDVPMEDITREMATSYRSWWIERMLPGDEQDKPAKANTANRHIGNMRRLYEDYFTYIGQEERLNPFRKMFFKSTGEDSKVPPFEDDWVRSKVLQPGLFADLNDELRLMIYILIETGARTSEICNLRPENIHLECDVPYIAIRPKGRELKTHTSRRDLPLVGVALEAMRHAPQGFPRYQDKGELVSANLMKAFRQRDLFPTPDHVIYSFRHAFEDRMLEVGVDYGMRCYLMGHKNTRPDYGKKGSLEYRRDLLLKFAHPYKEGIIAAAAHESA